MLFPDQDQIVEAVKKLVDERFGGDYRAAFLYYGEGRERVGLVGIVLLMKDANIGSNWTRKPIGRAIISYMDQNADGLISWEEFLAKLEHGGDK